ncbi:MAG TPA: hypothetical protein VM053_12055 [Gemmatimonadaceae bacterium]|nr:hypothetical protein [Gemmatimonadaceae bacterium]
MIFPKLSEEMLGIPTSDFTMIRTLLLTFGCLVCGANAVSAQALAPAAPPEAVDSTAPIPVTSYAVKSGKIALSSAMSPKPVFLPDGTYTNDGGTVIVIVDGVIVRLERDGGEATFIESVRTNRDKQIMLTPSTNALMQVTDMRLPSGTFRAADGKSSFSVVMGRPTAFNLPGASPEH